MRIAGIGIDSVEIERFKKIVDDKGEDFLKRIFTPQEISYSKTKKARMIHMAGKFAAKEAVKKALPDGAEIGLNWKDIEILNSPDGKPYARLHGEAKRIMDKFKLTEVLVSISHTGNMAVSNAMAVQDGS